MIDLHESTAAQDEALGELLLRWQELRDEGRSVEADELCAGRPELAPPLRERIAALRAMEAVLGVGPETVTVAERGTPGPAGSSQAATNAELPGYEVLEELGRGGMGVVYKARHIPLNRAEALKMILAGGHASADELARFRTEVEAVARLRHPNVVQVYSVGEWAGQPYVALEFVEGGTLAERLKRGPLPGRDVARLTRTLALAVQHAHEQGIVHRDLKPSNVLLSFSGRSQNGAGDPGRFSEPPLNEAAPKIADFGLARLLDGTAERTRTGAILGTPSYLAPEQAEGKKDVGPAADIYALGAILYECLTGRPPFQGESTLHTLDQVRRHEPVRPRLLQPGVPRDLENICLQCLQKEPGRRYPSAAGLADDLGRFLEGRPVQARPAPVWERVLKWVRRQPALAALLLVSVLAASGLLGLWAGFTAELAAERNHARAQEAEARTQQRLAEGERARAQAERAKAQAERDRARRQRRRAERILTQCVSAIDQYATATRTGKTQMKREGEPGALLYSVARSYAGMAASLRRDEGLAPADRDRLAERYAARAVEMLDKARADGYFASPRNRARVAGDAELAPLRGRGDFKTFLDRLKR
jgi:serine/threonine protein kinase